MHTTCLTSDYSYRIKKEVKCHEALSILYKNKNLFKTKFSNVSVALIYILSHNTRHIAFRNLELTCKIIYVHNHDMWPSKLATYIIYQPGLTMSQVWRKYTHFLQIYLSVCTFLVWYLTSHLEKKYRVWPRHYVYLFQTWWKCSIYFYLEF